jgi:serine/threonine-protein phosphatase Stp1
MSGGMSVGMSGGLGHDSRTHVGKVRKENEDAFCSRPGKGVWVVADGMGGHANGRFASQTIVEEIATMAVPGEAQASLDDVCDAVADAIARANATVNARGVATKQMGSTVVILVAEQDRFAVLWAGDSRAYLLRGQNLLALTRDHTQVEDMVQRGLMTIEEAARHPMKHVLSRAVGVNETVELDGIRDTFLPGDVILLCSDGLSSVVPEQDIAAILGAKGLEACDDLIAASLDRGAPDNVTVTLVAPGQAREPAIEGGL